MGKRNRNRVGPRNAWLRAIGLCALILLIPKPPEAQEIGPAMKPGEAKAGTLLLRTAQGLRSAPTLHTDVQIEVTGMIARTTVEQRFHNPSDDWVEGVYAFPLPERSAVDTLALVVGGRLIVGEIQTREQARATYEKAKKEGRKASLLEQERPNIFTTSVSGIGPGEQVRIGIEYQEDLRYDQGGFSLRFPMVIGPRYIPGAQQLGVVDGAGWAVGTVPVADAEHITAVPVADAERITPPVVAPGSERMNRVRIRIELDAGMPLARVHSPSHAIRVESLEGTRFSVELSEQSVPADSDFVLSWRPAPSDAPVAAIFHEQKDGEHYALLMIMPPDPQQGRHEHLPRETIFVIDTSGSMHGESIEQAKRALVLALARLQPADRFNVIAFASTTRKLFPRAIHAQPTNIDQARSWVDGLEAEGGTEMLSALQVALDPAEEASRIRQVIFITDGAIGDEARLFSEIRKRIGRSRLFTVGIGSAPNSHFMARAAELGRGTSTLIGQLHEVQTKMGELFSKLESPMLHDIELGFEVGPVEVWPARAPDLYLGEPIVIAARLPELSGSWTVGGQRGSEPWQVDLALEGGRQQAGIARLWARRKIASLTGSLYDGADPGTVREAIVALGMRHHLVTRHTSLVAVDVTPTVPPGVSPDTRALPVHLPKGWSYEHVFGELRARERPRPPLPDVLRMTRNTQRLPQGGTPAAFLLWIGLGCLLTSAWFLRTRSTT
ncbi:MAG: marine proteobacterial sortase target protein [bacterium]|nr:marine proteobacterial sortase target protein [bacterium]